MPYFHQRLATLEVRPVGSPNGGEPVPFAFADGELMVIEAESEEIG
ncbi:MAG: hypothetical protein JOZ17_02085 [Acetobacteraceae bacterium]|nr:hypothetical protein [Acetobacteraceae bacterium]